MTVAAHNVLAAFDALDPKEQRQVVAEILRRATSADELTDDAFDELAAEVFRSYDTEEEAGGDQR
jgi:hypothetical protein